MLVFVTHRTPSAWNLVKKMRAELDAAVRAAEAEPTAELRVRKKLRAYAMALRSAWRDA
jgi:hypothetical protein